MSVLTRADFATTHKVSRAAVTQAVGRGTLGVTESGDIDLRHSSTAIWIAKRKQKGAPEKLHAAVNEGKKSKAEATAAKAGKRKAETEARKSTKAASAKQAENDILRAANELTDWDLSGGGVVSLPPLADIDPADIGKYPKDSLDKLRIFEVALKTQQDREHKRGDLIPRDLVAKVFAKIQAVDSNEWRTLEERLIPTLCSVAGFADDDPRVLKIQKAINKETTRILKHTQRLIDTFLVTNDK